MLLSHPDLSNKAHLITKDVLLQTPVILEAATFTAGKSQDAADETLNKWKDPRQPQAKLQAPSLLGGKKFTKCPPLNTSTVRCNAFS